MKLQYTLYSVFAAMFCVCNLHAAPDVGDDEEPQTDLQQSVEPISSVLQVTARQRYPWNGKVDIDCKVSGGAAGRTYALNVTAHDKVGGTNLTVRSVSLEGGTGAEINPVTIGTGQSVEREFRLVWDAGKDLPQGFKSARVSVSVGITEPAKKYLVIELASGAVTYMSEPPDGGFDTDEYKTTKMAFIRIEPQSYMQCESETYGRKVTITRPFYIALQDFTRSQGTTIIGETIYGGFYYDSILGYSNDKMNNYYDFFGLNTSWPKSADLITDSPLSRIRGKCGLNVDIPTVGMMCLALRELDILNKCYGCVDYYNPANRHISVYGDQPLIDPKGPVPSQNSYNSDRATVCFNGDMYDIAWKSGNVYIRLCIYDTSAL